MWAREGGLCDCASVPLGCVGGCGQLGAAWYSVVRCCVELVSLLS